MKKINLIISVLAILVGVVTIVFGVLSTLLLNNIFRIGMFVSLAVLFILLILYFVTNKKKEE